MDLQPPASGEDDTQGEMLDCWTLSSFQSDTWCNLIGTKHCADLKGCQTGSQNTSFTLIYHLFCSHVHNNGTTDKMWSCQEAIDEASSPEFKESPLVCDGVGNMLNLILSDLLFSRLILVQTFPNECVCSKLPHRKHVAKWDSCIWIQHTVQWS